MKEIKNKPFYEGIKIIENLSKKEVVKKFKNIIISQEKSKVKDLFNLLLIIIFKGVCGKEIYSLQVIVDYPLFISAKKNFCKRSRIIKKLFL